MPSAWGGGRHVTPKTVLHSNFGCCIGTIQKSAACAPSLSRYQPAEKSLELSRRVRERRKRDRLGDARRRHQLSSRRRTAETPASSFSRPSRSEAAATLDGAEAASAGEPRGRRPRVALADTCKNIKDCPYSIKMTIDFNAWLDGRRVGDVAGVTQVKP
jgi:hypothetical protein